MAKCVHQGCGKIFADSSDEVCNYHPGPPIFHEGQKGWKCCKPRVLTFEEFMSIPPCTEGKHSTTDLPPQIEKREAPAVAAVDAPSPSATPPPAPRVPIAPPTTPPSPAAAPPESEDDDPALEIPNGKMCRRRGCGASYSKGAAGDRAGEKCVHHPGAPIFHEGSKGYTCCKRRVLEFDQFMKIEGCETKGRHLFVGSGGKRKKKSKMSGTGTGEEGAGAGGEEGGATGEGEDGEELLESVRHDFYQSAKAVTASFFLKKIDKSRASVSFSERAVSLDLPTADATRYRASVPLFAAIDPASSSYKVLGTKLEVVLAKAEVAPWPVLRSDDRVTGEILQVGRAGSVQR